MRVKFRWMTAALALAACAMVLLPTADVLARAGGGTSSSHHSSGGYSSRRSSSSSSSYNSRNSWSSNRNRRTSYGGSQGYDPNPGPPLLPLLVLMGGVFLVGLPLVVLSKKGSTTSPPRRSQADRAAGQAQLQRMAREDDGWSVEHMQKRITETYHAVQQAWTQRDQEIAKDFMSPRLYAKHKRMTDEMLAQGRRNVLEDIHLLNLEIVHVADRKGIHDDEFWVVITGAMVDYEVQDAPSEAPSQVAVVKGLMQQLTHPPRQFQELWKFTRDDRGWVLDKIEQDLNSGLAQARLVSQEAS